MQGCILPNVLLLGTENGTLVKCDHGQNKKHHPGDAHQDDHGEVHHVEALNLEQVSKKSETCDPAH